MNTVKAFHKFLKDRAARWSNDMSSRVGVKFIRFSGEIVREILVDNTIEFHWRELERQLPHDAVVLDVSDGPMIQQGISCGQYTDDLMILFASEEWEPVADGEPIPEFRPVFERKLVLKEPDQTVKMTLPELPDGAVRWGFPHMIAPHDDRTEL